MRMMLLIAQKFGMTKFLTAIVTLLLVSAAHAQSELQQLNSAQRAFEKAADETGIRSAFLEFLTADAIVFNPRAVNGLEFWKGRTDDGSTSVVRNATFSDIAANGMLGYTTGNWRTYQKGKSESAARFGQYVTVWEKQPDGKFRISLDIAVTHEKLPFTVTNVPPPKRGRGDLNKRGWSPADASMSFLKLSMANASLGGAYKKYAADDVRLLRDQFPPISGKKLVERVTRDFVSIEFPSTVALFQSADMAYTWNRCEFDNTREGSVAGNCLHIWKLRNKKWWIVLGVIAVAPNETRPTLKITTKD